MTVKEIPSGQMQMPLHLINFKKIQVPSTFASENVYRTCRETKRVVKYSKIKIKIKKNPNKPKQDRKKKDSPRVSSSMGVSGLY